MRVLLLSNGHGEDLIGSRLARHLLHNSPDLELIAVPLVGPGQAYSGSGVRVMGPLSELPSAGLTLHSAGNLLADLQAGLVSLTLRQLHVLRYRSAADAVIVVGDVWALALSLLTGVPARRRFAVQTLVSVLQDDGQPPALNRLLMERITPLERLLQRRFTDTVWLRDEPTAMFLQKNGVKQAAYAGSLLFDSQPDRHPAREHNILLLPGSRRYATESLATMLPLVREFHSVDFRVAWAHATPPEPVGWQFRPGEPAFLERDGLGVEVHPASGFERLLSAATVVVGTAGTAIEQAALAGVPVVTFPLGGSHSAAFVANQARLLPGMLHVAESGDFSRVEPLVRKLLEDGRLRERAAAAGARLLGRPGGLARIAREIATRLQAAESSG